MNYRSNCVIVDFANKWINSIDWEGNRHDKEIYANDTYNDAVVYKINTNDAKKNASLLAQFIKKLKRG